MTAEIDNKERVNNTPGAPNGGTASVPAQPGKIVNIRADGTNEYVAASSIINSQWYSNYPKALPWAIDDVTQDFGDDLYNRMALDPKINQTLSILKTGIIEEGLILNSPIIDLDDPDIQLAAEIRKAAQEMFDNLDMDTDAILWDMLNALHLGNKVAELIFGYTDHGDTIRLDIKKIHIKPRRSLAFVVDAYGTVIGLTALIPGVSPTVLPGQFIDPDYTPNILPREKFWIFTSRQEDQDPRGTSILRPAYEFWNIKHQLVREYLKYLTQFASASLFATTPEGAEVQKEIDPITRLPTGNSINPWEAMRTALEDFRNGSVMTAPFGTLLKEIFSQGDGTAFVKALDFLTREIVASILGQTLASEEGQHQSRSASSIHQNILDSIIRQMKRTLCYSIRADILVPWVRRNWGAEYIHLAPKVSLGETETPNLPQLMTAVANLFNSSYVSPSQLDGLDRLLNLTQRTPEEYEEMETLLENKVMTNTGGTNVTNAEKAVNHNPPTDDQGEISDAR